MFTFGNCRSSHHLVNRTYPTNRGKLLFSPLNGESPLRCHENVTVDISWNFVMSITNVFSYGLRLTHCSFRVGSFHVRMCFFRCISLARVFIPRISEFSLSSYRSSKYFLALDFIILGKSFSIDFCLCFRLPQGRLQPHPQDICFTFGWPGLWSKTFNVSPYKYKQPSQLKPSPRPTGQQQFPWSPAAGQSHPK